MPVDRILEHAGPRRDRALVFAAGGSADIILAQTIAAGLVHAGFGRVDLAQPLNCKALSEKDLLAEAGRFYALSPEPGLNAESVLRHHGSIDPLEHPDTKRGKGISISSSLQWDHGARYVCAAHGSGCTILGARSDGDEPFYDLAVGVDGGGDVLTHDETEFDRVVLDAFQSGWRWNRPLILVAMGLGADGGSSPEQFREVELAGYSPLPTAHIDASFVDSLRDSLESLGLWNPDPAGWSADDPYWGYGLKVPQIIAMAVHREFPFDRADSTSNLVSFPRRGTLKSMDQRLLREARLFLRREPR